MLEDNSLHSNFALVYESNCGESLNNTSPSAELISMMKTTPTPTADTTAEAGSRISAHGVRNSGFITR